MSRTRHCAQSIPTLTPDQRKSALQQRSTADSHLRDRLMEQLLARLAAPRPCRGADRPCAMAATSCRSKASGRRTLRNIVHDQSNTGTSAVYRAALQTVELNAITWRGYATCRAAGDSARILRCCRTYRQRRTNHCGSRRIGQLVIRQGRYSVALNSNRRWNIWYQVSGDANQTNDPTPRRGLLPEDAPLYALRQGAALTFIDQGARGRCRPDVWIG